MREIKFRAFDTENKTWTFVTLGDLICGACTENGDKPLSGARQVWEQCIGFKDKKGKDIYYGDIIKVDGRHVSKDDARVYEVIEDEYYCSATTRTADGDEGYIFFNAEATKAYFTVIGNIYENPELLKEKK